MSSIHLRGFVYCEPATIDETVSLLNEFGSGSKIMAGGIDLIPRMREGSVNADYVVNIRNIPELTYFSCSEKAGLEFGAMTTLQYLDESRELKENYPIIRDAIHQITSVQTKYMGTAVGNLCVATPGSDIAPALIAYDAEMIIAGINGARREKLYKFYPGKGSTSLQAGEFVTGVFVPKPAKGTGAVFMNKVRTHADIAKITLSVVVTVDGDTYKDARIALGAVAPTAVRAEKSEAMLRNRKISAELIREASEAVTESINPSSGLRSTKEYRTEVTPVLVRRALEEATEYARRAVQ